MNDSGSSTPGGGNGASQALTVRQQEKITIERRRELVAELRFHQNLGLGEIAEVLAAMKPPIIASVATLSRDADVMRAKLSKKFRSGGFDPVSSFMRMFGSVQHIAGKSFRLAERVEDTKEKALHHKIALDATRDLFEMSVKMGLMVARDFQRPADEDGKKVERIPTGEELRAKFESISVQDAELISDAERAWKYGDDIGSKSGDDGGGA